jgi:hypothetical protein
MEITQRDRDALRQAQQKLNSNLPFSIGNIVEHKIQDPATYRAKSRREQGLAEDARPELPVINYNSLHLKDNTTKESSQTMNRTMTPDHETTLDDIVDTRMTSIDEKDELRMDLPITQSDVHANLWLNMDRVEFEKLEWMSEKADREYIEKLKSSTHFDADGKAVSPPINGEEPQQQQVHDIGSLVKLLDSSFQPQVTYALKVISKIATHATTGLYDAVFDENIHQVLLKECLLRVRHHIDSPNETICQSALQCLRSLICNTHIDEIILDKLYPIKSEESDITMWLSTEQENFDIDMKDNECVYKDTILGLIARTDILTRFKCLLSTKIDPKFSHVYHDCILDLLIRIARYSPDICWILNNNEFPKVVIEHFLPADIVRKGTLQQSFGLRALKFLRIIAQAAKELERSGPDGPVIKLPHALIPVINTYYYIDIDSNDTSTDVLFKLQIETLRLMKALCLINEFSGHVFSALTLYQSPLIQHIRALTQLNALKSIECHHSLDWQYAASLLDLLGSMMNHERLHAANSFVEPLWDNFIQPQTMKWFNDIIRDKIIPHQDVSIALYVAANTFIRSCRDEEIHDFYSIILLNSGSAKDPSKDASLQYFKYLLREATNGSQLISFLETNGRRRDPVMLQSYGFMDFNTSQHHSYKLNSIIGKHSPYILLNLYLVVLRSTSNAKFVDLLPYYIDNIDLVRYMRIADCYHKYPLSYEYELQRSTSGQLEVRILGNASLLLSKYYLDMPSYRNSDYSEEVEKYLHFVKTRAECYSQLILHVISIIGLINPDIESMLNIKVSLLKTVVFNECLHSQLMRESYSPCSGIYKNMKFNELNRHRFDGEASETFLIDESDLSALETIYLSCEQPGRFWLLQPLIEYYHSQIQLEESKRVKNGKYFLQSINKSPQNRSLSEGCDDIYVISQILRLNALLMYQSSSYFGIVVKQNIEEYLCLIGSIFLDDNLFLDTKVSRALWYNIEMILTAGLQHGVDKLFSDASQKIATLNLPLVDFFNKLLDQYEAASYNDVVFANYLLLFLSPKCDKIFRKKLFSDKLETCLSQMRIAHSDVWIPTDLIAKDKESDPEIRYLIKLSGSHVRKSTFLDYYRRFHTS